MSEAGTITTDQAAKLLMISTERVRQLSRTGHIPKVSRGRFHLVAVVQGYLKYLKDDERRASISAAESRVRDARAAEIERRMAREDREIIAMEEAMGTLDEMVGLMLATLNSLPAMITRNPRERRRIEDIVHRAQGRLAKQFAQRSKALAVGQDDEDSMEDGE